MNKRGLLIKPGGVVEFWKWSTETREHASRDVTGETAFHLMEDVSFDENVTLLDIFKLIEREMPIYQIILNNWVEEFIKEAQKPLTKNQKPSDLDYLILHWGVTGNNKNKKFYGAPQEFFPRFSGWGKYEQNEYNDQPEGYWGVDFCAVNTLVHLPIKLDDKFRTVINEEAMVFDDAKFTLFQVLYAIIWELSFYGAPKRRTALNKKLKKQIENIESGKEKTIPFP